VKLRKQQFIHSVMSYINLSLFTIIGITLLSIFFSFWITEQADSDAHAINLSGSMRMQTYHIGLAARHTPAEVTPLMAKLDKTWNAPLFANIQIYDSDESLQRAFFDGYRHWFDTVRPALLVANPDNTALYNLLTTQVKLTNLLVSQFQLAAESKIRSLRTFQLITMLLTTLVGSLIFYLLKNRVEAPLTRLTEAAQKMSDGHIQQNINISGKDELALLAEAFNQMSKSITETYQQLESRVEKRTSELQHSNTVLEYSFNVARNVLENQSQNFDYQEIIHELSKVLMLKDIELCLFTLQGEKPYIQLDSNEDDSALCTSGNCGDCKGNAPFNDVKNLCFTYKYPVIHHGQQYGVIKAKQPSNKPLLIWQQKLLQSSADQLAIALSLQETKEKEHRLVMLSERTVMARELHDSLAQSLSYLKIQVTRLQKSHDMQKYHLQQPIINELSEGLSSAYRHLRELLTTFRLKIDDKGLKGAVEQTITQLKAHTDMELELAYTLQNIPLSPSEEIHLLQIMREGSQNAVNHSKGTHLRVALSQLNDKTIQLIVADDGVGLSDKPEKLNHYGLAIIEERSRHLKGDLVIESTLEGVQGTRIQLKFTPNYLQDNDSTPPELVPSTNTSS